MTPASTMIRRWCLTLTLCILMIGTNTLINMKIDSAYVRAKLSMSKRLKVVKEPGAKRHRTKCGMEKNGFLSLTDVFGDERRSVYRSDLLIFGGRTSLGRGEMRSRNGLISSRNFYGRNIRERKCSWAVTSSWPKYRKESDGLLGWEAIKFYVMTGGAY